MPGDRARERRVVGIVLVLAALLWGSHTTGLVSSNDGSHVALARALVLRGETRIDPEMALTLRVDLARRDGHHYSDRPPGTAFAALPSIWMGAQLDPWLLELGRRRGELIVLPACEPYIHTYAARVPGAAPLAGYMGTALALAFHTVWIGVLALWGLDRLLRRRGVGLRGRALTLVVVASGTLWGPYSTLLFSHGTALALLVGFFLALDRLADEDPPVWVAPLAGLAGAWAIGCDFLLVLAVVPCALLGARPTRWLAMLAGAAPVSAAVLAYHHLAFGHPFSVGYAHHANFSFAREGLTTFDGNLLEGAWTLLGFGRHGAGLLAQAPVAAIGALGWWAAGPRDRRTLVACLPWLAMLCLHHTPWGGATEDHRYLVPGLPLIGIGIGLAWERWIARRRALGWALAGAWLISVALIWSRFLSWHETPPFPSPVIGLAVAASVALAWLIFDRVVRGSGAGRDSPA